MKKIAILLIGLSCIAVYSNSFSNPFIWDDHLLILQNPLIKSWQFLPDIFSTDIFHSANQPSNFYRPLQMVTLSLDYHLWRLNPAGYHLTNLMLHLLTSILVYFLILHIGKRPLTALLAGLLFTVHPVHTEAVTYIAGRAEPLLAVFLLSSLLTYIKNSRINYLFSILFFILALLSKELALIFPLILLLYEFTPLEVPAKSGASASGDLLLTGRTPHKNKFGKILPFFIIALGYLYFRFYLLGFNEGNLSLQFNRDYFLKIASSSKLIFSYLGLLIFPRELQMQRTYVLVQSFREPLFLLSSFLLLAIIYAAFRYRLKSGTTFFFSFWFFIFLLPFSNLIKLNALMAEHWLYLASIGFFALVGGMLEKSIMRRKFSIFIFIPLFLYFSMVTGTRNFDWGDEINFYKKILTNNPKAVHLWYNLGTIYLNKGKPEQAETAFKKMLALQPDHSEALVNLGAIYSNKGKLRAAENCARKAIKTDAKCKQAYCLLGYIYSKEGSFEKAEESYLKAIEVGPNYYTGYLNLGCLYANQGKVKPALVLWQKALQLNPDAFEARYNLGLTKKCEK